MTKVPQELLDPAPNQMYESRTSDGAVVATTLGALRLRATAHVARNVLGAVHAVADLGLGALATFVAVSYTHLTLPTKA